MIFIDLVPKVGLCPSMSAENLFKVRPTPLLWKHGPATDKGEIPKLSSFPLLFTWFHGMIIYDS